MESRQVSVSETEPDKEPPSRQERDAAASMGAGRKARENDLPASQARKRDARCAETKHRATAQQHEDDQDAQFVGRAEAQEEERLTAPVGLDNETKGEECYGRNQTVTVSDD